MTGFNRVSSLNPRVDPSMMNSSDINTQGAAILTCDCALRLTLVPTTGNYSIRVEKTPHRFF
jgi:hypothetical protein